MSTEFGNYLRAARLGFRMSTFMGCFMRVSGDGPYTVELCTPATLPKRVSRGKHWLWWEGDETGEALCVSSTVLRRLSCRVFDYQRVVVDEDGERVEK